MFHRWWVYATTWYLTKVDGAFLHHGIFSADEARRIVDWWKPKTTLTTGVVSVSGLSQYTSAVICLQDDTTITIGARTKKNATDTTKITKCAALQISNVYKTNLFVLRYESSRVILAACLWSPNVSRKHAMYYFLTWMHEEYPSITIAPDLAAGDDYVWQGAMELASDL